MEGGNVPVDDQEEFNIDSDISGKIIRDKNLPRGPSTGTYHNPETGQEFYNLPTDPFSMEHYTKRHRLQHDYSEKTGGERLKAAFGTKLVYGPAPPELKEKWEQEKHKQVVDETANKTAEEQANQQLINMVKELSQEVKALKSQLNEKNNGPYDIIEVEEKESEPEYELNTQIPMFE